MSSLQLGLIVAGVLLVVAVIVYNVWQERRVRRSVDQSRSGPARPEPEAARRGAARVEPTLVADHLAVGAPPLPRTSDERESSFEPPFDVIAPPASLAPV